MSMTLEFEPHSWYMSAAIRKTVSPGDRTYWEAVYLNGITGYIIDFEGETLKELKQEIRGYHLRQHTGEGKRIAKKRLNYLRGELQAERISYGELIELVDLKEYIDAGDVELLEAAGVEEAIK